MSWPDLPRSDTKLRKAVFLGRDVDDHYKRCWTGSEDSVGIVGPPRYGKTSGLIIPTLLTWDGPAVCTSTRGDIADFTALRRRRIAEERGGEVLVYDPFGSEPAYTSMRWSPLAGCADSAICYRRVAAMTAVAGGNVENADHWRAGAASILRGYFHAAALEDLPLAAVRQWLARQEVRDPTAILRMAATDARMWADDLESLRLLSDRERGSFFSVARNCLEATAEPTVLRSCSGTDLDIDRFLATSSTLYVIGPSHHQQTVAPLLAALVDSIAQRAAEVAAGQGGRLQMPLLLALDEIANIAPLHSLPSLVSEGGGRGIITLWAAQSLAQLRSRYGPEQQSAILAATTAKVIFGGLSNGEDLHNISAWAGEVQETHATVMTATSPSGSNGWTSENGGISGRSGSEGQRSLGRQYRPALPIDAIQMMPPSYAWLFYRSDRPVKVEARPAGVVPELVALASGGGVLGRRHG